VDYAFCAFLLFAGDFGDQRWMPFSVIQNNIPSSLLGNGRQENQCQIYLSFFVANDLHNLRGQLTMPTPDAANPRQVDAVVRSCAFPIFDFPTHLLNIKPRIYLSNPRQVRQETHPLLFYLCTY